MNIENPVAGRYAEAFASLESLDTLEAERDIQLIAEVFTKHEQIREFFSSPRIQAGVKKSVFKNCFEDKIGETTLRFILLLIDKRRESELGSICSRLVKQNDKTLSRVRVEVTTARDFSGQDQTVIEDDLKGLVSGHSTDFGLDSISKDSEFIFSNKTDENILGGVKIRIQDEYLDASVLTYLHNWKKKLSKSNVR